ncbi:hypothetical protein MAM1_0024c01993 [Mucor ambiguus]|uniref:BZIP domain-containing protein n=1 Tax=Mucor ambiguus TaxID=91626 RepID=A0A0C9M6T2_9FUNG|nr:hypothetical protein MAM1_0024c01993 [Mucor ambiguus]
MTIPQEEMHNDIKHKEKETMDQDEYYDVAVAAAASAVTSAASPTIALNQTTETMLITPLNIHNLPANILQHLQQQNLGNVITTFATAPHSSNEKIPTALIPSNTTTTTASSLLDANDKSINKNLTADERRQRRLWRNRVAAKECRKKKKQYVHELEETIMRLESENSALRKQVEDIKIKVAKKDQEQQPSPMDNFKLMKQVEELNAKLGNI